MSRFSNVAGALAAGTVTLTALMAGPAQAATPVTHRAEIVGRLGIEGGAYPGRFRPTAGTVFVAFDLQPLVLVRSVGPSGRFDLRLSPGEYTLTGCGPASSASPVGRCGPPQNVTLVAGEVDHVRLPWLLAP